MLALMKPTDNADATTDEKAAVDTFFSEVEMA